MINRSDSEDVFAQSFQFFGFVPETEHVLLRDFLYKFAFNYDEAKEYLKILTQVYEIDYGKKSELLNRINGMALQSFALAMRRMTDNISKRGMQELVTKVVRDEFKTEELSKIKAIYTHYKGYLDKGVAHQDKQTIHDTLAAFPGTEVIEADMNNLRDLYNKLAKELCSKYISIEREPHDYDSELKKLALDK